LSSSGFLMTGRRTLGRPGETRFGRALWSAVSALIAAFRATFAADLIASVATCVIAAFWPAIPASTTTAAASSEASALAVSSFGRRLPCTRRSRIWNCGVVFLRFRTLLQR